MRKAYKLDRWGKENNLEILCLSETKVNTNCTLKTQNYTWFFSTNVDIKDRNTSDELKENSQQLGPELRMKITEHHGVAIAIKNTITSGVPSGGHQQ